VIAELITHVGKAGRAAAGDVIEEYLRHQTGANWYWPDNEELAASMRPLQVYRRLSRARLRMVLEAIEDHLRGWRKDTAGLGGERVARGKYAIEHIMPRRWQTHWRLPHGQIPSARDALIDTIGNLTLLTGRLNSKVSNGPWAGSAGKRGALHTHDVLILNRQLLDQAEDRWDDDQIQSRTERLICTVLDLWPVPEGHRSGSAQLARRPRRKIDLTDLIGAGLLQEGATLHARRQRVADRIATVLADGALDIDGIPHRTPSAAARAVSGNSENGWTFWLVDASSRRSLMDLWREYTEQNDTDTDDDDEDLVDEDD
jgi:hypothetical protein